MSRSPSADVASPVFGRFLLLVRDWNTGELLPLGRNVVCQCAMCARRRTHQSSPAGAVERPPLRRAGFTLVEMVVVLLILALLTVAAVQSLSPVADQARYDATSRTLQQLNEAMLGTDGLRQSDGTPLITGFVADVGRVPVLQGANAETQLSQLWDSTSTLATSFPFQTRIGPAAPTDYSAVRLPCGWRGPYLQFGVGVTDLRDGWANPFTLTADGSDNLRMVSWNAVPPYTNGLVVKLDPTVVDPDNTPAKQGLVAVSGTLTNNSTVPTAATIVLLYPNPSLSTTALSVMTDADATVSGFQFNNVPIGFRALRADIDGHVLIKYLQVPQQGLSLNVNYQP